jgi:hypothetical protein
LGAPVRQHGETGHAAIDLLESWSATAKARRMTTGIVTPGREDAMAADPQCARCKQAIGPGWLYLTAHRRGQAAPADDDAVLVHLPDECPRAGEHVPPS